MQATAFRTGDHNRNYANWLGRLRRLWTIYGQRTIDVIVPERQSAAWKHRPRIMSLLFDKSKGCSDALDLCAMRGLC